METFEFVEQRLVRMRVGGVLHQLLANAHERSLRQHEVVERVYALQIQLRVYYFYFGHGWMVGY